ncbi:DUF2971 domain-containing protein [Rhodobacter sp. SY28-1]|uniref:DUF2971 domain-containing protein n=1 Tax=Rhodobacter sp. SY28-1 TaxID=2562317 RepID=UPI001485896E|nr:DUF2971 domain-containing protein [Rhodobacter sp. SY28-1]
MAFLEFNPTTTLYQYTTLSGFEGIISSKSIWFTDLRFTNDPREITLGRDQFLKAVKLLRDKDFRGQRGLPISVFVSRVLSYLEKGGLLSASFTTSGDNLPMWSAYGGNYAGFSIGFRPTAVRSMPVRIQKVNYIKDDTIDSWRQLLRDLLSGVIEREAVYSVSDLDWLSAATRTVSVIVSTKHKIWEYENEIRCTHAAVAKEAGIQINGVDIPASEYPDGRPYYTLLRRRARDETEVSYAPIQFGKYAKGVHWPEKAIERVILGPKCPCSVPEVTEKLNQHGFTSFEVMQSECLIR